MLPDYFTYHSVYVRQGVGDFDGMSYIYAGIYKGFIQPTGGGQQYKQGKGGEQAEFVFYTELRTPVDYGHKIVDKEGNSVMMLYTDQPQGISGTKHHKEIACSRFQ